MKINLKRTAVLAAVTVVGAMVALATPASAAEIGKVIGPSTGNALTAFSVRTTAECTSANFNGRISSGNGGWVNVPVITSTPVGNMTTSISLSDTLSGIASANGVALVADTYTLTIRCGTTSTVDTFSGQFVVTGSGNAATFTWVKIPTTVGNVSVTPPSPQNAGTPVNLSVTVGGGAEGSVQFKDGAANLGAAVPVAAGGTSASLTGQVLTGPSHSLTAVFTPTDAEGYATATSATATPYTINTPAVSTSIVFGTTTPASPAFGDTIVLKAIVSPAGAAGTVQFKEGSVVGTGTVNTTTGEATASIVGATQGTHTYSATFVPTNPAQYITSNTTTNETVTVGPALVATAQENITVAVAAGTLTITAGGPTVDLGTLALNSNNTLLVTQAPKDINTVTVTDTRAGSLGWNVNGVVGEFSNAAGDKINSANLGWAPRVLTTNPGQTVTAAAATAPGAGVAVGASSAAGLQTPKPLATSPVGASVGTATITAALTMQAPTTTKPGQYNSVLTLTAV